jgi:hypothetical protein
VVDDRAVAGFVHLAGEIDGAATIAEVHTR